MNKLTKKLQMFDTIIDKLSHYLINKLGFVKDDDGILIKTLSPKEYSITPYKAYMVMHGGAFGGLTRECAFRCMITEDYISDVIMDRGLDDIEWTEEERNFFSCSDPDCDELESSEAYEHWCEVEDWVAQQRISTNREEMMEYVTEAASHYTPTEA